jgi:hypothetical protein
MVEVQAVQKQMRSELQQRFTRFRPSGYGFDIFFILPARTSTTLNPL